MPSARFFHPLLWKAAAALWVIGLGGCACLNPQRTCHRAKPVAGKLELVRKDFGEVPFTGPSKHVYRIFFPKGELTHPESPPVLLLHEMPALNAETLELAERIASHGYRVYVPLLFGGFAGQSAG